MHVYFCHLSYSGFAILSYTLTSVFRDKKNHNSGSTVLVHFLFLKENQTHKRNKFQINKIPFSIREPALLLLRCVLMSDLFKTVVHLKSHNLRTVSLTTILRSLLNLKTERPRTTVQIFTKECFSCFHTMNGSNF